LKSDRPEVRAEAHLLDFQEDLYGKELELTLEHRLREERRFESLPALQAQIRADVEAVRAFFGVTGS
jgi:riboflavin kinase/FMN adenylyltransferase